MSVVALCINLATAQERWNHIQTKCSYSLPGVPLVRLCATIGKKINVAQLPLQSVSPLCQNRLLFKHAVCNHTELDSHGAFGCSLSHANAWKWLLENTDQTISHILVLEDDCCFDSDFTLVWHAIVEPLRKQANSFELFVLGYNSCTTQVEKNGDFFEGSHCYLVNKVGCEKLLKHFYPMQLHVDYYLRTMICRKCFFARDILGLLLTNVLVVLKPGFRMRCRVSKTLRSLRQMNPFINH